MSSRPAWPGWTVLLAVLLGVPGPAGSQEKKPLQRIQNHGFENGLAGWKVPKGMVLIEDPGLAHSGVRCLLGEVTRRNTGKVLKKNLKLRDDRLYQLVVWARSDSGNRLTIWVRNDGRKEVIGNWAGVPGEWRRYRVNFTVKESGPTTLGIVAPSSHIGPAGRMWIDDVRLFERRLWPHQDMSKGEGFSDFPVMTRAGPGNAWLAWLSFRDGKDTLQVVRLESKGRQHGVIGSWQAIAGTNVLHPVLAGAPDGSAWLVYAAERDGNWEIAAQHLTEDGPGPPVIVASHPGSDVHPAAVVHGGKLWICWESNRDEKGRQIYMTAVSGNQAGTPMRLSTGDFNNYTPAINAGLDGSLWVVWHSFREDNFDLYGRNIRGARPGSEVRLTSEPCVDRDVRLASHGDQLWLAWEHAGYKGYKLGLATTKRVRVARLVNGRLKEPVGLRKTRLWEKAQSPEILVDDKGRLWISARIPRDRHSGWDVVLWRYARNRWSEPFLLSQRKGRGRRSSLAVFGPRALVAYQGDDLPGRWFSAEESQNGASDVYLVTVEPGRRVKNGKPVAVYPDTIRERFEAARIRTKWGEDRDGWKISHNNASFRLLFGDLHEHSELSVCSRVLDESPDQVYQMMRDIVNYDFGALTDHGKNFNSYFWNHLKKTNRANRDPGRFEVLLGQEWSSSFEASTVMHPYGYYGHRNLILADPDFPVWFNPGDGATPSALWEKLVDRKADFVLIPHQLADTGNVPVDWTFHHEKHQPVAEIFQGRGSYECKGCPREAPKTTRPGYFLQDAWASGVVIGAVAGPDHFGGLGKAAVYAKGLSAREILEAIRARRTYATTGAKIFLDVRVNGHFMGEVGEPPGKRPVRVDVRADCPAPVRSVEILRNNEVVFRAELKGKRCHLAFVDEPPEPGSYYYVRLTQKDGEIAWSSPVWLGHPRKK